MAITGEPIFLRDVQLGKYCANADITRPPKVFKITQDRGKCLYTRMEISLESYFDTRVVIVDFPSPHVCYHEAAHLVVGLDFGSKVYQSNGILFSPYDPDAGELGHWIKLDAKAAIRLSLVGILAQILLAPDSIEKNLLQAMERSVIFGDDHPIPANVSNHQKAILAGAWKDIENAKQAGKKVVGNSNEDLLELLRSIEAGIKEELRSGALLLRIKKVGDDIPFWFQHVGLNLWEEAVELVSCVSYPAERAKLIFSS